MDDDERYSISHLARCFGLRVSALRYYDEMGLLPPAERRGTVRYYGRAELRRLALIQHLHQRGMVSLADTAALIGDRPSVRDPAGRELLAESLQKIARQIEDLRAAQHLLVHLLRCPTDAPVRECTQLHAELDEVVDAALNSAPGHAA
ncbi:MerR family transcriptional regulator [Streptomyces sp. B1866]|uniref:MerR family transcriptional regulator n=1 Tax=Streptomyces sp. B1866 TaxID=3075431 RepID=UPI00288DECF3|nr:MerR family transcriptional regulator [Streptomyces sp. B1866]MDT3398358.1 MerR family transcriptional regulator [Streptomyces sp. B1866]